MTQKCPDDQLLPEIPIKLRKNDMVSCTKCGLQLPRKKLKKHKKSHKALPKLEILSRSSEKTTQIRACQSCSEQCTATWFFERTTRGPLHLCKECKTRILKASFSHDAIEKRRIESLKSELRDLIVQKSKLPPGTIDPRLSGSIIDIKKSIDRGPVPKATWSPILPGSFGNGKRR